MFYVPRVSVSIAFRSSELRFRNLDAKFRLSYLSVFVTWERSLSCYWIQQKKQQRQQTTANTTMTTTPTPTPTNTNCRCGCGGRRWSCCVGFVGVVGLIVVDVGVAGYWRWCWCCDLVVVVVIVFVLVSVLVLVLVLTFLLVLLAVVACCHGLRRFKLQRWW